MNLVRKTISILRERGAASLLYIAGEKLKNKTSEQQKYRAYIRNEKRRMRAFREAFQKETEGGDGSAFCEQVTLLETGPEIFSGIEEATTPYVAFLEPGDVLSGNWKLVVGLYLSRHSRCRFLYTDEDRLEKGRRCKPVFKPDWSPDTYLSYDYAGGLLVMDRGLAAEAKEQIHHKYKESFLYELGLRASAMAGPDEIGHLPEVLYHRRMEKKIPKEQAVELKKTILRERGLFGQVSWSEETGAARIIYRQKEQPLVSVIVPSKDQPSLLAACIRSVEMRTEYANVEWIIVDNGSGSKKAYEELCAGTRFPCTYLYEPMEFNFSKMCNLGAKAAKGSFLLFLNDDMELPPKKEEGPDWLSRLVGQAALPDAGAVGAKLLYPDSVMIQHLGVVNYTTGAAHLLWQASDEQVQPFLRNHLTHNYAVVTGACMMIAREKFFEAGGFEERLAVTFNDVELCIRLLKAGYYQTVRSDVVLYHHESISRGQDALDEKKFLRGLKERELLFDLHPDFIGIDPFYSRHLTQTRLDHTMDYPRRWRLARQVMPKPGRLSDKLAFRLLRITRDPWLCIEGWAYEKGQDSRPVTLLFEDTKGELTAFSTEKRYSPTIAQEQERTENLDFSEFFCRVPEDALAGGRYEIYFQIGALRARAGEVTIGYRGSEKRS